MITSNVLQRTFHLQANGGTSTGFLLDHHGRQYLVTAAHCVPADVAPGGLIGLEIMHNEQWLRVPAKLVGYAEYDADIVVLTLPHVIAGPDLELASSPALHLTQEVYFVGFPYGMYAHLGLMNNNYPMPFVKKGIISAFNNGGKPAIVYLDGQNNPGFSGGPVVSKNPATDMFEVIAVVSGYRNAPMPVQVQGIAHPDLLAIANSGIVITYNILHAIQVIESNPIGAQ